MTLVALLALLWHLRHGKSQILNFKILKNPVISLRAINFFILQFTNIGISFVIPIFAQAYLHQDTMIAGLMLLPGSLVGALISPVAGGIYDRHGAKLPLTIGNLSMFVGCALLWWLTQDLTVLSTTLLYIFLRLGFNFGFGNTMSDASKMVTVSLKGDVNALFNTMQQFAGSLGTSVLSAVISASALSATNAKTAVTVAAGSHHDFLILIVLAFTGLLTTLTVSHLQKRGQYISD